MVIGMVVGMEAVHWIAGVIAASEKETTEQSVAVIVGHGWEKRCQTGFGSQWCSRFRSSLRCWLQPDHRHAVHPWMPAA